MEKRRTVERLVEFQNALRQQFARRGVANVPRPPVGREERLHFRVKIENRVLSGRTASGGRVSEKIHLRNQLDAEFLADGDKIANVVLRRVEFIPAQGGRRVEGEDAPKFQHNEIELVIRR